MLWLCDIGVRMKFFLLITSLIFGSNSFANSAEVSPKSAIELLQQITV